MAAEELCDRANNLPIHLTIMDVANFLGVSRSSAYKLTHTEGFPALRLTDVNRRIIPKKLFLDWYCRLVEDQTNISFKNALDKLDSL